MAINKNFVIKNGVQVDTNLIVGDSTLKKVGIGTTVPQYTLHVHAADRGGIGVTDINVVGVATIANLNISGFSTFTNDINVSGMVSAQAFAIGKTEVIDRGFRLSGISSLDAITIATIEEATRVGPNSFSDLKVAGLSTFLGIATFLGGIDVNLRSGVSTFSAPVQFGMGPIDGQVGLSSNYVAVGGTVGFGTSAFFRDNASIFMGDGSDFRLYHDNTNSYIDNMTGALYLRNSVDDDDNSSIILQAKSGENSIVMTNSADESNEVELYYDNSKKLQTTSGGLLVSGITTLTNRLHVQAGVSTFDADTRFGIGATVGFGTSAFFKDDAAITVGDDDDFFIKHSGGHTYLDNRTGHIYVRNSVDDDDNSSIIFQAKSGENSIVMTNSADESNEVELYYDNSKKLQTTSGGLYVTGIATLSNRLHVLAGVSTFDANTRFGIGATVGFGTSAFFKDDAAIFLGDDSDLKVHHDGSNSYIQDVGTGDLILQGSADIKLQSASGENYIIANDTGSVEVYYDNSKKLESTSGGLNVTGITTFSDRLHVTSGVSTFADATPLMFGNQSDLEIKHSSSGHGVIANNTGNLYLYAKGAAAGGYEQGVTIIPDLAVELYWNGTKKAETTEDGIVVGALSSICVNGNAAFAGIVTIGGDLNVTGDIVYDEITGRNLNITGISTQQGQANFGGTLGIGATIFENGNVAISGITTFGDRLNVVSGVSTFQDNAKLTFGAQGDLGIHHNGTNSIIQSAAGGILYLAAEDLRITNNAMDETGLRFNDNNAIELYFNGVKEAETTEDGILVGTGVTIQGNGGVSIAGLTTASGGIRVGAGATISSNGNATFSGITTFGGTSHIRVPNGSDAQRPGTAQAGDFRYNTDDGKFEGYTTQWGEIGGGGGVSQVSGIVSTTSTVGFAASFAHASFRSAHVNLLIVQGNTASDRTFMTGKYLMIHDGTTVTVVEQAALSTGDMLGTISGAIVGSNAELQVTMVSSGVATCSAKIDTMADSI